MSRHDERRESFYRRRGKRCLDLAGSILALLFLSPLVLATALLLRAGLGRPLLFRQVRPGLNGEPFTLIKFRTMTMDRDEHGRELPDSQRLTPLGRLARSFSLDELPSLLNVLRGDLSLVGPRPLLMRYLDRYTPEQSRRHLVKPGLTGWAQVNGRNALSWEEKFSHDVWYVDHYSLAVDLKILGLTVWRILRRDGIHRAGHATAPEFQGTKTCEF